MFNQNNGQPPRTTQTGGNSQPQVTQTPPNNTGNTYQQPIPFGNVTNASQAGQSRPFATMNQPYISSKLALYGNQIGTVDQFGNVYPNQPTQPTQSNQSNQSGQLPEPIRQPVTFSPSQQKPGQLPEPLRQPISFPPSQQKLGQLPELARQLVVCPPPQQKSTEWGKTKLYSYGNQQTSLSQSQSVMDRQAQSRLQQTVHTVFAKYDFDHSSTLDKKEFVKAFNEILAIFGLGIILQSSEAQALLYQIDRNTDGTISINELYLCVRNLVINEAKRK